MVFSFAWGDQSPEVVKQGSPLTYAPVPNADLFQQRLEHNADLAARGLLNQTAILSDNPHGASVLGNASDAKNLRSAAIRPPTTVRPPVRNPIPISSCDQNGPQITRPGTYVLTADLTADFTCLKLSSVQNVTLDCGGHKIQTLHDPSIVAELSSHVTIEHCDTDFPGPFPSIDVNGVDYLSCVDNRTSGITVFDSHDGRIAGNTIEGGEYVQSYSSRMQIVDNHIAVHDPTQAVYGAIYSSFGNNNTFSHNQIDGGWSGDPSAEEDSGAADDGVLLFYENGDAITDNQIARCYDTGVETVGAIRDLTIANNQISHTSIGVGEWYNTSWDHVTLSNNQVSDAYIFFQGDYDQRPVYGPLPKIVYFSHVTFDGNTFSSPREFAPGIPGYSVEIYLPPTFHASGWPSRSVVQDNVFINNHFDTSVAGPDLIPSRAFQDGGGNVWGPMTNGWPNGQTPALSSVPLEPESASYQQIQRLRARRVTP